MKAETEAAHIAETRAVRRKYMLLQFSKRNEVLFPIMKETSTSFSNDEHYGCYLFVYKFSGFRRRRMFTPRDRFVNFAGDNWVFKLAEHARRALPIRQ